MCELTLLAVRTKPCRHEIFAERTLNFKIYLFAIGMIMLLDAGWGVILLALGLGVLFVGREIGRLTVDLNHHHA
jgi:hypothetical protein